MIRNWQLIVGSIVLAVTMVGCKTTQQKQQNSTTKPQPVAYQKNSAWLNQLSDNGITYKSHRTHLEVKLPIEEHFNKQANVDKHLVQTLKPIAKQLKNNHYQLAEVLQYVDKKNLSKEEKAELSAHISHLLAALNELNVETKVVVKGHPKQRRQNKKQAQTDGSYIAINLYQRHQGHGLVY